ncbi:MAG: molybdopterin molybdotransferase MoeA [Thermoleophilaceae bacterium]
MSELIDIATARRTVLESVGRLGAEQVPVVEALGRILAEDVQSDGDVPPFDSSAMDGYAVVPGPARQLRVAGESRAGHPADRGPAAGEALAISTGAMVPAQTELAVVPVERVRECGDGVVAVPESEPGANVRRAGEDVRAGAAVLPAGIALGPPELAVAVAAGRARLRCSLRPRVAVLVTGDELVDPGQPIGPGQIRSSNGVAVAAQAAVAGAEVVGSEIVRDDAEATAGALARALEEADVVCVSGGVSVGPHDHVRPALKRLGVEERFWGVSLRPGKPTWFGVRGGAAVFGLPGNPVSAIVTFHLFARPALRRLAGTDPDDTRTAALLDAPAMRDPRRDQVLRCSLSAEPDGWHVTPAPKQGSHILTSMLGARALALVPAGEGELGSGSRVAVELLSSW